MSGPHPADTVFQYYSSFISNTNYEPLSIGCIYAQYFGPYQNITGVRVFFEQKMASLEQKAAVVTRNSQAQSSSI